MKKFLLHILLLIMLYNCAKAQKQEEKKLDTKIKKTNAVALQAVQKEINLEEMIKNEEKEREFKEEEEMKERIAKEQDKQVILI